jgi:hypothetical protein
MNRLSRRMGLRRLLKGGATAVTLAIGMIMVTQPPARAAGDDAMAIQSDVRYMAHSIGALCSIGYRYVITPELKAAIHQLRPSPTWSSGQAACNAARATPMSTSTSTASGRALRQ